jgi:hypothetical protein
MAKRKKKGSRRRSKGKSKKSYSRRHKTPLAASLGGAKTAWDVGKDGTFTDLKTTMFNPSMTTANVTVTNAFARLKTRSGPVLLGVALSYGDKVPVIGKLYKPVKRNMDSLVRSIFGKGYKF